MTNFSSRERKVTTMVSVSSGSQVGEEEQDLANQHCGHVTGCRVLIGCVLPVCLAAACL